MAFRDPELWNPGFANTLSEVKDLRTVADGDVLAFAGFSIEVDHTPGHTPGHCCFRTDAFLLSGDLVFAGAIGRSDFPNSSPVDDGAQPPSVPRRSPTSCRCGPGHGQETSVGRERATNPFLRGLA